MREKVINGLKRCIERNMECRRDEGDCPYIEDCKFEPSLKLKYDALKLIEAHPLTEEDFEDGDKYGWIPVWTQTKNDLYCECVTKEVLTAEHEFPMKMWVGKPSQEQLDEWDYEDEEDS